MVAIKHCDHLINVCLTSSINRKTGKIPSPDSQAVKMQTLSHPPTNFCCLIIICSYRWTYFHQRTFYLIDVFEEGACTVAGVVSCGDGISSQLLGGIVKEIAKLDVLVAQDVWIGCCSILIPLQELTAMVCVRWATARMDCLNSFIVLNPVLLHRQNRKLTTMADNQVTPSLENIGLV